MESILKSHFDLLIIPRTQWEPAGTHKYPLQFTLPFFPLYLSLSLTLSVKGGGLPCSLSLINHLSPIYSSICVSFFLFTSKYIMNMNDYAAFKNLKIDDLGDFVVRVSLNRPRKYNALNLDIWFEIGQVFQKLDEDENCRCVILEGEGKHFSTGLDLLEMSMTQGDDSLDTARRARRLLPLLRKMQDSFTQIEKCSKPVLIGIHGYCLGGGIDIITAGDVRFATKDAIFSVKEVDIGMAADVGTLNRLPKCVGNQSWVKDISLTARHFGADEAMRYGLVSRVMSTREEMQTELVKMAKLITNKSPVGVQGTKIVLNYSRDHTVQDSLDFVATWNMSQLFTDDMMKAGMAIMSKEPFPPFSKL